MTNTTQSTETAIESDAEHDADDAARESDDYFGSETALEDGNGDAPGEISETPLGSEKMRRYLAWGALGLCAVLALIATFQFYWSVGTAIDLWVDERFQPLMRAAFNLVVLLGSLIGISLLVRELS